jgi:DNA-binding NarL/FixJ family response regulator
MSFGQCLVLEDLQESRAWLERALTTAFPDVKVSTASTVGQARTLLASGWLPDLALIDLGLPDGSGVQVIEDIQRRHPGCLSVVTSIYNDDAHVFPALRAGATGYLLKDQPISVIVQALQGIAGGTPPISPAIARRMLAFFRPVEQPGLPVLTERETDVLRIIAKGMTQAECARLLSLSPHTVSGYLKDIYRKLNVCTRAEAALLARDMGLV